MHPSSRRFLAALTLLILANTACRTATPAGEPFAPLVAMTPDSSRAELEQRRDAFRGARALVRIRATSAEGTRSFRAQIHLRDASHVELTAYTPVGTVAATMIADGDRVTLREAGGETRTASARELGGQFGIFNAPLTPAQVAMLIIGLPPAGDEVSYAFSARGIERAMAGDLTASFDPPVYPPEHVVIERGSDRVEIDFLELGTAE